MPCTLRPQRLRQPLVLRGARGGAALLDLQLDSGASPPGHRSLHAGRVGLHPCWAHPSSTDRTCRRWAAPPNTLLYTALRNFPKFGSAALPSAPLPAALVPIRRPRSRVPWLGTRHSELRSATCSSPLRTGVVPALDRYLGVLARKSPATGCAWLLHYETSMNE